MQLTPAPMMEAAQQQPQQFYDGGVVALNGGGDPRDYQLSQMLGIQPTAAGRMSQEEMDSARSREMAAREIFGDSRMNGQMGSPDMYGAGTNIGQVGLHGQYTPFTNQAIGQANISQPMAGGIANIGATGTLNPTGGRISSLNASYGNPDVNVSGSFNPKAQRFTGRVGHDGYGVSADYGKGLERVGADYSDGQTMGGINYMPGQNAVQGHVSHRLDPNTQLSLSGQYGKNKEITANVLKKLLDGELRAGIGYGGNGLSGNVNLTRSFAKGGPAYTVNPADFAIDPNLIKDEPIPEVHDMSYYQNQAKEAYGPSGVEGYQDALAKQRANLEANKKNYLSDFLIQSGLGMASSKSVHPLQAAAEGATQGFKFYQQSKVADEQADRNLTDAEFKFKQAERAERAGLFGLSRQLYNDAYGQHKSGLETRMNAQQLRMSGAAHLSDAQYKAASLTNEERRLGVLQAQAGSEAEAREAQIALNKARLKQVEEQTKYIGQAKPVSADKLAAARVKVADSGLGRNKLNSLMKLYGIKNLSDDPTRAALVDTAFNKWLETQVPSTEGVYLGPQNSSD
jgi:hypothetical protein